MATPSLDRIADRWLSSEPVYLTDLGGCRPAEALSDAPALRRWRALEYTTDSLSGTMLLAGPETAAPAVTYPLDFRGWHAISIGVLPVRRELEGWQLGVLVRLSDEPVFGMVTLPPEQPASGHAQGLVELFWKVADLTGRDLQFGQTAARVAPGDAAGSFECPAARIAYVKLVPLTDAEVEALRHDRHRTDTRQLFAHQDAHGPHYRRRLTEPEEIRREIEPYRDTDFSRLYWECGGGDLTWFFSQIARVPGSYKVGDFGRRGDRLHWESWQVFRDKGIDPFDVALEYAHEIGLEFHASYRVAGFHYPPPLDQWNQGETLFKAHPEWRGRDRDRNETPRLAYSYQGVREYVVSLLREVAQRSVDGVCLLYCRRPPLLEYEPALVEGFQQEFGRDPHELDPHDPDWLAYRARTLTQFMREVRAAMDEVGRTQRRPKRIQVSAVVMSTEAENLNNAMDLKAWVDEGLVDTLIPYTSAPNLDSMAVSWADPESLEYFVKLVEGTEVILAPNVMPRHQSPEEFRRRAATIYGAGASHLFFWDCAGPSARANHRAMWNALRRLGHRDEIEAWREMGEPELGSPTQPLRKLGDWDLTYATPG